MHEVKRIIPAGGTDFVDAAGDFIFCSFTDRPFRIYIDEKPVTVKPGDKLRPEKRFKSFQIENLDTVNPIAIILVVGEGDYNSQTIRGDVTVTPVLRKANGTTATDSRRTIHLDLAPQFDSSRDYVPGDIIQSRADVNGSIRVVSSGDSFYMFRDAGTTVYLERVNPVTLEVETSVNVGHSDTVYKWALPAHVAGSDSGYIYAIYDTGADFTLVKIHEKTGILTPLFVVQTVSGAGPFSLLVGGGFAFVAGQSTEEITVYELATGARKDDEAFPQNVYSFNGTLYLGNGEWECVKSTDAWRLKRVEGGTWQEVSHREDLNATADGPAPGGGASYAVGRKTFVVINGTTAEKRAHYPLSVPLAGVAVLASCGAMFNRLARRKGLQEAVPTLADVDVLWQHRRATLEGQVIRLALEWYFGGYVDDDYLDHVYGVRIFKAPGTAAETSKFTGAETFQKAGITDDFKAYLPSEIELIIDNGVSGEPLY